MRLNKKIPEFTYCRQNIINMYSLNGKVHVIYSNISNFSFDIFSLIPEKYRRRFVALEMQINSTVVPHTDYGIICAINIYVIPGNCITTFYSFKEGIEIISTNANPNTKNLKRYDKSQLNAVSSFTADKNDGWILDVTKPHSVDPCDTDQIINRIALSLQTKTYTYHDVKDMLMETGYL